jgi:PAS domain S-box-containing protein
VSRRWHFAPFPTRVAASTALLLVCLCAQAASPSPCARTDGVRRPLPDVAVCLARAGIVAAPGADDDDVIVKTLFAHEKDRMAVSRFDDAESTLDCVEAVIAGSGDNGGGHQTVRYELVRRRGILDYRRERIPEALSRFECALSLSKGREDRVAIARDLKNVGTALRRLGDFHGALRASIESLEIQRASGEVAGAVLSNIADIYRGLDEPDEAMRYYNEAYAVLQRRGDRVEAAHVLETMSAVDLDRGVSQQAASWLQQALRTYRESGNRAYEVRVYAGLTRAALASGEIAQARDFSASALAVAAEHDLPLPASLQLQAARVERLSGHADAAAARLRDALGGLAEDDAERAALLEELAASQEAMGDRGAAIATLRRAHAEQVALARAQHDRQLGWLRTRFETAERDRTIAALETENHLRRAELRQRTLLLWLTIAITSAVGLGLWMLLQRRRQRERLQEEARRVRQEEELARYRREADALAEDRSLLQALLDSRDDAVCMLDAEGQVLAANRAACRSLGAGEHAPVGHAIAEFLAIADQAALTSALERMEDTAAQTFDFIARDGTPLLAHLAQWEHGDGLIVLGLQARVVEGADAASPTTDADDTREASMPDDIRRNEFRRSLVELMLAVIDTWERATGSSRLELAEKSRIWRVAIDDGRLRARAMERYLTVAKLPHNPRWRDVLRSAYFVLGQCTMEAETREDLQRRVDAVLAYTRRSALV